MSDLISREEAIDLIHKYWKNEINKLPEVETEEGLVLDGNYNEILEHNKAICTALKALPSAEKVGEWEDCKVVDIEDTMITEVQSAFCPICHKYHTTPYMYYFDYFNYCPNCGARMERSE